MGHSRVQRAALTAVSALAVILVLGVPSAMAGFHGVAQTKQCTSPTKIGDPYTCTAQILNVVDAGGDTIRVTGLSDTVNASGGDVSTANILGSTGLVFTGAVSCVGGSGAGTSASPYVGATECLVPFGANITTKQFSHYTVQAGDFDIPTTTQLSAASAVGATNIKTGQTSMLVGQKLIIDPTGANPETRTATSVGTSGAGGTGISFATPLAFAHAATTRVDLFAHRLTDTVNWNWNNTCVSDPDNDCTTNAQVATAGASSIVQKLNSATSTAIHNGAHQTVTVLRAGAVVHDFITVSGQPGSPIPSGSVSLAWFTNGTCAGAAAASRNETLTGGGTVDATDFPQGPLGAGRYSFQATYLGDATYEGSTGACEPLSIVDARIHITPSATNRVGFPHTFTAHVEKNLGDGNGWVDAAGVAVQITVANSLGASANPAGPFNALTNAQGLTTATFTSATPGKVTGHAVSSLNLGSSQDPIFIQTDGVGENGSDAVKTFVDARIHITPSATNRVGFPHTFTAHVEKNLGDGNGWVDAAGVAVQITVANSLGGSANPAGPFNALTNAQGLTTATFTSATPGKVTGHAVSSLNLGSQQDPIFIQTDGAGQNGSDAVKTFVDARIHITPDATNVVGQPHTFTAHVEKNLGNGAGWVDAAGVAVQITLANAAGAAATPPGPFNALTDANGLTTATFTSNTPGTVTGHAVSSLNLGSQQDPIFIQTDGLGQNGSDAVKRFVNANIQITPANANNPVNTNHVLTITVNALGGTIDAGPHTATASIVSGPGSFVGSPSCTYTGGGATASCTVTITSATTGTTVISATSNIPVSGLSITRTTNTAVNTAAGGSGNANKNWADAATRTDIHDASHGVITTATQRRRGARQGVRDAGGGYACGRAGSDGQRRVPSLRDDRLHGLADRSRRWRSPRTERPSRARSPSAVRMSYKAHYNGDANYPAGDGACEPLAVQVLLPCPAGLFLAGKTTGGTPRVTSQIAYDQFPAPNDNSYGVNAVGWPSGHTFGNLTGSDKAGFQIIKPDGTVAVSFNIDYISSKTGTPSGYASLGPFGGDGSILDEQHAGADERSGRRSSGIRRCRGT